MTEEPAMILTAELYNTTDAAVWASKFREIAIGLGYSDMDEGWLIGWFANAIMRGYDMQANRHAAELAQARADIAERDARLAVVMGVLDKISTHTLCHGPGCFWCDNEGGHPRTRAAIIAQEILSALPAQAKALLEFLRAAEQLDKCEREFEGDPSCCQEWRDAMWAKFDALSTLSRPDGDGR